jgi:multisubunit Na+/H+ antiporter MnhE subunit
LLGDGPAKNRRCYHDCARRPVSDEKRLATARNRIEQESLLIPDLPVERPGTVVKAHFSSTSIAHAVGAWVAFFAFYLLFTGTAKLAELAIGGCCGGLVAAFGTVLRVRTERPLRVKLGLLWPIVPGLGQIVPDAFRVAGALLRAFRAPPWGSLHTIPAPAETAVGSAAGRGIAIAAASLAPNSFAVDAGDEAGGFIVHRLAG